MRLWIASGGTGGHVYPALAVVEALREARPNVLTRWIGSRGGVEEDLVARAGIAFDAVPAGGVHGLAPLRAAWNALKLAAGVVRAAGMARAFRPHVLLVTGGFVSVPAAVACWLRRTPILVYLPDIEPGLAVKLASRLATRVAVSVDDSLQFFPKGPRRAIVTGYPIRSGLAHATRADAIRRFALEPERKTLLVFGGSKGARSLNHAVASILDTLVARYQVIHISGPTDALEARARRDALPDEAKGRYHLFEYLHDPAERGASSDMGLALAAADVAVSRAGASVLGEFPLLGVASILVPYPYAWRYQKVNADYLTSRGAALRLEDGNLMRDLLPAIERLMNDDTERRRMQERARALARPDAASRLAAVLAELSG
ncbi:MAG TPA: UDP-N-acetylglucosamine--N-acetylmuramyl-(pentapeptide) pyrophosphoryl-undecaprenol N-acetylglucosamine transferase [Anaerolineae bacterium]|nr:UDP-N-acetylglucosamine--N-acetylmuramyl-(pentapeptide) pyrophosphoryl-undecaprenol N-acetylglucosamine transferase [Anaerolineae bacterium]